MTWGFLQLSLSQALSKASGDRVSNGQLACGDLGFSQDWCQSIVIDLANGLSCNVSGMVFPVNEDAFPGCCCGSVLPQRFTSGRFLSKLPVQGEGCFLKDWG